jgi:hypothetical protein
MKTKLLAVAAAAYIAMGFISTRADACIAWANWHCGGPVELIYVTSEYINITLKEVTLAPNTAQCLANNMVHIPIQSTSPHYKSVLAVLMMSKVMGYNIQWASQNARGDPASECVGPNAHYASTWIVLDK